MNKFEQGGGGVEEGVGSQINNFEQIGWGGGPRSGSGGGRHQLNMFEQI